MICFLFHKELINATTGVNVVCSKLIGDSLFENMELFGISRRQMLDLIQVG
jgi:hypothetical protein